MAKNASTFDLQFEIRRSIFKNSFKFIGYNQIERVIGKILILNLIHLNINNEITLDLLMHYIKY